MMIFITMVLNDISINLYMGIKICPSSYDIRLSKYGMSGCHGDYLIELGWEKSAIYVLLLGNRLRLGEKNLTFLRKWTRILSYNYHC